MNELVNILPLFIVLIALLIINSRDVDNNNL